MAGSDGYVDETERIWLEKLAAKIGVGRRSLDKLIEQAESDPGFYKAQLNTIQADPLTTIRAMFGIAAADGILYDDERLVVQHFAAKLGVKQGDYDRVLASVQKHLKK